jgi:hypothetical protein
MYVKSLTPILNVRDLEQSFAWFAKFGWTKGWDWKADPARPATFGAVCSGECEIFLCLDAQGGRGVKDYDGLGVWMSLWIENVDAIHAACVAAKLDVAMPPTDEPWRVREMHVRHPDGHMFRVSQSVCETENP